MPNPKPVTLTSGANPNPEYDPQPLVVVGGVPAGEVTSADITDASEVGVDVLTAADAAAARSAIGAGTSNLTIGTSASTAKAGDYQPTAANISDSTAVGQSVLTAADAAAARTAIGAGTSSLAIGTSGTTAAAGNHTHTFTALAGSVSGATGANLQAILDDLAARVTALEP